MTVACFEGGGVLGLAHVGAWTRLQTEHPDIKFTTASGSSAGALIALAVALGLTPEEMKTELWHCDFSKFCKSDSWFNIWRLFNRYGWFSCSTLQIWIQQLVRKYAGTDLTFEELKHRTGMTLVVAVSNITTQKVIYLSPVLTPDMDVAEAVSISCRVPFMFESHVYTGLTIFDHEADLPVLRAGDILVDGGGFDNLPLAAFNEEHIIAFDFIEDPSNFRNSIGGLFDFLKNFMLGVYNAHSNTISRIKSDSTTFILMKRNGVNSLDFKINNDKKKEIFNLGINYTVKNRSSN
jgi:predicted acylesterase/phospholipase RssA